MIRTGIPAPESDRIICSRRCGAGARGSINRLSLASSVVNEMPTRTSPRRAMSSRMSMSRSISAPLVTMATGCPASDSTRRQARMISCSRSIG